MSKFAHQNLDELSYNKFGTTAKYFKQKTKKNYQATKVEGTATEAFMSLAPLPIK